MSPVEINVLVQDVSQSKPEKSKVSSQKEFLGNDITVTKRPGYKYEVFDKKNGIKYNDNDGIISSVNSTNIGTAKVKTKKLATKTETNIDKESVWSEYKVDGNADAGITYYKPGVVKATQSGEINKNACSIYWYRRGW